MSKFVQLGLRIGLGWSAVRTDGRDRPSAPVRARVWELAGENAPDHQADAAPPADHRP